MRLLDHAVWEAGGQNWLLPITELEGPQDKPRYFVPLAMGWEEQDEERMRSIALNTAARVRQQANVGVMGDAFMDDVFAHMLVTAISERRELPTEKGLIRFKPTSAFPEIAGDDHATLPVGKPQGQSSNTLVTLDERLFVKGYRRLREGTNPEYEIGCFLTETVRFEHCVPVAGVVEYEGKDGTQITLGIVQAYVPNQGDGWDYTLDYLERYLELRRASTEPVPPDVHGAYLALVETLGRRTAQLHMAFAQARGSQAFEPERLTPEDLAAYRTQVTSEARATLGALESALLTLPESALDLARSVLERRESILQRIEQFTMPPQYGLKTRYHGDYHLAQVLLARNDFVITDFEGEPGRSFEKRREKHSPLKDVAGMLRSFSYARAGALRNVAQNADEMQALAPHAAEWEAQVRQAFLGSYHATARAAELYESLEPGRGLLGLFELEKALYELRYELNNRPDWVDIPLHGISTLA